MTRSRFNDLLKKAKLAAEFQAAVDGCMVDLGLTEPQAIAKQTIIFTPRLEAYAQAHKYKPAKSCAPPKTKREKPKFDPVVPTEPPPLADTDVVRDFEWVYKVIGLNESDLKAEMKNVPSGGALSLLKWAQAHYNSFMTRAMGILNNKKKADNAQSRAESVEYQNQLIETAIETARRDAGVSSRYDELSHEGQLVLPGPQGTAGESPVPGLAP